LTSQEFCVVAVEKCASIAGRRRSMRLGERLKERVASNSTKDSVTEMGWESRSPGALVREALDETPDAVAWLVACMMKMASNGYPFDFEQASIAIGHLVEAHEAIERLAFDIKEAGLD